MVNAVMAGDPGNPRSHRPFWLPLCRGGQRLLRLRARRIRASAPPPTPSMATPPIGCHRPPMDPVNAKAFGEPLAGELVAGAGVTLGWLRVNAPVNEALLFAVAATSEEPATPPLHPEVVASA